MTRTHQSANADTAQQKAILRQSKSAQTLRARFPVGTRVAGLATGGLTSQRGTVQRHVPGTNAQGGYLVVKWDNGNVGRHSAISLAIVEEDTQ